MAKESTGYKKQSQRKGEKSAAENKNDLKKTLPAFQKKNKHAAKQSVAKMKQAESLTSSPWRTAPVRDCPIFGQRPALANLPRKKFFEKNSKIFPKSLDKSNPIVYNTYRKR